jgi:hypothetical protein
VCSDCWLCTEMELCVLGHIGGTRLPGEQPGTHVDDLGVAFLARTGV